MKTQTANFCNSSVVVYVFCCCLCLHRQQTFVILPSPQRLILKNLQKLNQSTENQFIEIIKTHQGILHKVCGMYRHDPDDKKDLFQEIVIQLWRALPKFRQESKISTWIYQIALNVAISDFRKESRRPKRVELSENLMNISDNIYDNSTEEQIKIMHHAIAQLSDIEKAIVMLYFEEKNNEEIADIVGITQNNVRVKMTRIREKLRVIVTNDKSIE